MAYRPGQVRDAIFKFFEQRGKSATASTAEIREHVERTLGPVSPSSVRSYLQIGSFERVGRGVYRRKG